MKSLRVVGNCVYEGETFWFHLLKCETKMFAFYV